MRRSKVTPAPRFAPAAALALALHATLLIPGLWSSAAELVETPGLATIEVSFLPHTPLHALPDHPPAEPVKPPEVEPVPDPEPESPPEPETISEPDPPPVPDPVEEQDPSPPEVIEQVSLPVPKTEAPPTVPALPVAPEPPDTPDVRPTQERDTSPTPEGTTCDSVTVLIPKPKYPRVCIRRNQEGDVVVAFVVRANGTAGNVRLAKSSGVARLDNAALEAIRISKFRPALKLGAAVDSDNTHTFRFRLKDVE